MSHPLSKRSIRRLNRPKLLYIRPRKMVVVPLSMHHAIRRTPTSLARTTMSVTLHIELWLIEPLYLVTL